MKIILEYGISRDDFNPHIIFLIKCICICGIQTSRIYDVNMNV